MGVSVRQKKPGGAYWVFIRHGNKRKSKRIGYSKTSADKIADIIRGRLASDDLGIFDEKPEAAPTFKELSGQWLTLDVKPRCRATTHERYQSCLQIHVIPKIGKTSITDLDRPTVKNVLRTIVRKGLSRASVETAKICISGVCEFAIDEGLIDIGSNPARDAMKNIGAGKKTDREPISILTSQEVSQVLEAAKTIRPDFYFLLLCAFRTGMRIGEILALKWNNINWPNDYITVQKSFKRGVLSDTKTGKIRNVDMSGQPKQELRNLLHRRKKEAIRKGLSEPVEVIFHDKNCYHLSQNSTRNIWRRVLRKAGIDYRKFHCTRHTFASLMLAANVPISYVKDMMGHSSIQMTLDIYGH